MRVRIGVLLVTVLCCLLFAVQAQATDYAYGYTSIDADDIAGIVRAYHRTEVDYNSEVYYTPYVCGSLYKDDVEVVRACQHGFASATTNTQTPYYTGSSYSALSDHYVDIEYAEEDPYNPGYYYYPDNLGYYFSGSGSHPIDWYYVASGIYNQRPSASIRLGDTTAHARRRPHHLVVEDDVVGDLCGVVVTRTLKFRIVDINGQPTSTVPVKEVFLALSQNTCGNGNPQPTGCSASIFISDGVFGDFINVGCVTGQGTCGYNITKQYQWCRPGHSPVPLATYSGWTHNDSISVFNVVTPNTIPKETALYP
ncbi:MAG: hypothetical protein M3R69_11035 [Acidobacteriota bacterium]|nr:hypothetical protein [Acidobacteriota bacterium]